MNRAEMRRQQKAERKKGKAYMLNHEQLQIQCNAEKVTTMNVTMISTAALIIMSLRDEFGFGHDRIKKLMDNFMLKYECVCEDLNDKALTPMEKFDFMAIISQIKKETGYDLLQLLQRDIYGNVRLKERRDAIENKA